MEILFLSLISRGSLKLLGVCVQGVSQRMSFVSWSCAWVPREGLNPELLQHVHSIQRIVFPF